MRPLSKSSKGGGIRLNRGRKSSTKEDRVKWPGVLVTGLLILIAWYGIGLCDMGEKRSDIMRGGEHEATLFPDLKGTAADKDLLFPLQVIFKKTEKKDHCLRHAQIMYPYHGKEGLKKVPVKISVKKGLSPPSKTSNKEIPKGKASAVSPVTGNLIEISAEMVKEDEFESFKKGLPQEIRSEVERGLRPGRHWSSFIMKDPEKPDTCMEVIIIHKGFVPLK